MNRTLINLLCIIILTVLGASVLEPCVAMGMGLLNGFEDARDEAEGEQADASTGMPVMLASNVDPHYISQLNDTLTFDNGRQIAVETEKIRVSLPEADYPFSAQTAVVLCSLGNVVLFIIFCVKFIRFIVNINKGLIFNLRNIRYLNTMGTLLLFIALLQAVIGVTEDLVVARVGMTLEGVALSSAWTLPWDEVLLGTLSLLMAQIWRRGLMMKEEQELTI